MNAQTDIARAEFIFRFLERTAFAGVQVSRRRAASYWEERSCEPDFSPEDWADAHIKYGDDA